MADIVGTPGPDTLDGDGGDNIIYGLAGADVLNGGGGNDLLDGGADADTLNGGLGDDRYIVDNASDVVNEADGEGFDSIYLMAGAYTLLDSTWVERLSAVDHRLTGAFILTGNSRGNEIHGAEGADTLSGGGGADSLLGFGGNDTQTGGDGDDHIFGMNGDDELNGGANNDELWGGTGSNNLVGGTGDDRYILESAADTIVEADGEGMDSVYTFVSYVLAAGVAVERLSAVDHSSTTTLDLTGNDFGQFIWGNAGVNVLSGGGGGDELQAFGGNDTLNGGDGNDYLFGMDGNDTLNGGEGNDELWGGAGLNGLAGGAGDDRYIIESSADFVAEASGEGVDSVYTFVSFTLDEEASIERLSAVDHSLAVDLDLTGNALTQFIWGNAGVNVLRGGGGDDELIGFAGADTLDGGDGYDTLIGGAGADVFAFTSALADDNIDMILDFTTGVDKIYLSRDIFQGLPPGALQPTPGGGFFSTSSGYVAGTGPVIIYDRPTGRIYFDANGMEQAGGEIEFARVAPNPGAQPTAGALVASDFVLSPDRGPVANADSFQVMKGSTASIDVPMKVNDTDADGQALWLTRIGVDTSHLVTVGRGLTPTGVTGIYGSISGGAKSDTWTYTLNNSDPDTVGIAPGTTATETFYYEITDGSSGSPNFTISPGAAYAIGVITIEIVAAASGASASIVRSTSHDTAGDAGPIFDASDSPTTHHAWLGGFIPHLPPPLTTDGVAFA